MGRARQIIIKLVVQWTDEYEFNENWIAQTTLTTNWALSETAEVELLSAALQTQTLQWHTLNVHYQDEVIEVLIGKCNEFDLKDKTMLDVK